MRVPKCRILPSKVEASLTYKRKRVGKKEHRRKRNEGRIHFLFTLSVQHHIHLASISFFFPFHFSTSTISFHPKLYQSTEDQLEIVRIPTQHFDGEEDVRQHLSFRVRFNIFLLTLFYTIFFLTFFPS